VESLKRRVIQTWRLEALRFTVDKAVYEHEVVEALVGILSASALRIGAGFSGEYMNCEVWIVDMTC
jgi:hypothetical protein